MGGALSMPRCAGTISRRAPGAGERCGGPNTSGSGLPRLRGVWLPRTNHRGCQPPGVPKRHVRRAAVLLTAAYRVVQNFTGPAEGTGDRRRAVVTWRRGGRRRTSRTLLGTHANDQSGAWRPMCTWLDGTQGEGGGLGWYQKEPGDAKGVTTEYLLYRRVTAVRKESVASPHSLRGGKRNGGAMGAREPATPSKETRQSLLDLAPPEDGAVVLVEPAAPRRSTSFTGGESQNPLRGEGKKSLRSDPVLIRRARERVPDLVVQH